MKPCPCNPKALFMKCCKPYLTGKAIPKTAEQLMRSRYSAYTRGQIDYIQATMRAPANEGFDPLEAKKWAMGIIWQGLQVITTEAGSATDTQGTVEFIATYQAAGQVQRIHEASTFKRIDQRWYYTDAQH